MANGVNNYPRGKTAAADELTNLLGSEKWFEDYDWDSTAGVIPRNTGLKSKCRWVKNDAGETLAARTAVKYKAGYFGTRIGNQADAGEKADGIVDEFVGATGVLDGRHFWLVVEGITEAISDGNSVLVQGNVMTTIGTGTGKVRLMDATVGTSAIMIAINSRIGVVAESSITAVDATTFRIYIDGQTH